MPLIAAMLWLSVAVRAAAADRIEVAVAPIQPGLDRPAAALATVLERSGFSVISPDVVAGTVEALEAGTAELTDRNVLRVMQRLGVRVLLRATLIRERRTRRLRITPYVDGTPTASFELDMADLGSRELRRRLRAELEGRLRSERTDEHTPITPPPVAHAGFELPAPPAPFSPPVPPRARPARTPWFEVGAGISLSARQLEFASRAFPAAPRAFAGAIVPAARCEGAVLPIRHAWGRVPIAIGAGGELDRSLGYRLTTSAEPATRIPATVLAWSVGLRLRFGTDRNHLELGVGAGRRERTAKRGDLVAGASLDLPDVTYRTIEPGATMRLAIGRRLAVIGAARALVVRDAGPIVDRAWYGSAAVFGVSARGGLALGVRGPWSLSLAAELTHVGFSFTGDGAMANARDGDPTTRDVGGARDRTYGATLAIGVRM